MNGRFNQPCGIAVDRDGSLLVADTFNHRLYVRVCVYVCAAQGVCNCLVYNVSLCVADCVRVVPGAE